MADEPKPEPIQQPSPSQDTPNKTRTTPPGTKRLILTLTVLFSFVLALPILLKSTQIYRSPLPFKSIQSLSAQLETHPPSLPCHFHSIFLGFDSNPDNLGFSISNQMKELHKNDPICGGCGSNYSISVTIDSGTRCVHNAENQCSWPCGLMGSEFDEKWKNDDEGFDEFLQSFGDGFCLDFPGRVYTVVVVNRGDEEEEEGFEIVAGKYRNAWIKGRVSEFKAVDLVGKIFAKLFMNGGKEDGLVQGKGEFMPVAADGSAVLSFSLLNANPNDWIYDWDFKKIDDTLLFPVVEALAPIANISVESQVLYHTPKASQSSWDEKLASYVFSTKDLPFFVNSNEWHLDTSVAAAGRSKILQFVVYIPSAQECPLVLQLPNGEISMTNGFISPMWGGVIVWNPPGCVRNSQSMHPSRHTFSPQDLEKVFQVFVGQLRLLFGLKSNSLYIDETTVSDILASERGFAEWELDVLIRHHASFNLRSCVTTLGSLSRLVQSLPSMVVMDEIGKQVKFSLEAATLAQNNASLGIYDAVAVSSRQARTLAEDAFFHPSIMSLLYFPIEHHIAIYMPFFVPVSMHVLLAAFRELKRYRLERAKYLAWKSQL